MLFLVLISFVLQHLTLINANGIYTVVAPKTLRSLSPYKVAVTVHNAPGPSQISVSLKGDSFNGSKTVNVKPMSSEAIEFDIPKLTSGDYHLQVEGTGGIVFKNSTKLAFAEDKNWVYIQSDKATYKPGDLVQFRVLFVDKHTRPAVIDKPITIEVHDGEKNLIKRWKEVKPSSGTYSGELQLSDRPVLGNWTLAVTVQDEAKETKVLVVDKYVVPKFEVIITTPKDVAASAGSIMATILARYTFRKPVKGNLVVAIEGSRTEKSLPIDGEVNVELPISASDKSPLKIIATVTEELTDLKHNGTAYVTLHQNRYKLGDLHWPMFYKPGIPYDFSVVVKNLNDTPVNDPSKKVHFNVLCCSRSKAFQAVLYQSIATQSIMLPDTACKSCLVVASFENANSIEQYIYKLDQDLNIEVITKNPKLRERIVINVISTRYIPYFMFTVVARGNIVANHYVKVGEGQNTKQIYFMPTFHMVPQATIFVHYIVNGVMMSDEKTIDIERDFGNTIEITAPKDAKPGEEVILKIKTAPNAFFGLLGVDESVLLLRSGNDFNRDQILGNLANYSSDLVTLSNANINIGRESGGCYTNPEQMTCTGSFGGRSASPQGGSDQNTAPTAIKKPTSSQSELPAIRKVFPETWLFSNITQVGANGEYILRKAIPDTMTSWVITGFSLSPQSGLAVTRSRKEVRVFQPFFLTTNLPYSVKRGEVIAIPVLVFNYQEMAVRATVTMDNSDGQYDFIEATSANVTKEMQKVQRRKTLWVQAGTGRSISFMIRPKKVGLITLKITAVSAYASDAIHQILRVEPDGVTKYVNKAILVNLQRLHRRSAASDLGPPEKTIMVEDVNGAIEGSELLVIEVGGTVQAPFLENLDQLVRLPHGCGEQNMFHFVPSVLALTYLQESQRNEPEIFKNGKQFAEIGYQRELTYKRDDGSFSAWGQQDPAGSTWLTAYVIRSFHQASRHIDIDPNVLTAGLDFLKSRHQPNGEFAELGKVIHNSHGSPLALTSFVLLTFFENRDQTAKYLDEINKAVAFVARNVDQSNDPYDLSIAALALTLAHNRKGQSTLNKLEGMAKQRGGHKWWSRSDHSVSNDVEITSYVLLALLEQEQTDDPQPIIDWLISKRNSNGGFASSQDTVVATMALTEYEMQTHVPTGQMDITLNYLQNKQKTIEVTPRNELTMQTHQLPNTAKVVTMSAAGQGRAQVQLSYRYNVDSKEPSPSFKLTINPRKSEKYRLALDICGEYTPVTASDKGKPTNMALMQVQLPSGYVSDPESFADIKAISDVKSVETKDEDTEVHIYFEKMRPNNRKCFTLKAIFTHAVANHKPSWVRLYDYYVTERSATEYFHVESSLCDLCQGIECGSGCPKS
ncbi:CD109 antigen [Drosophila biarmipes]|uniref:CD109 antigen n=1 Tax=Drosophila biarmipes TaxID=125945 RepID=UPI0007E5E46D|nr:CD109 antigen [Drosophila biarmipes]